MERNLEPIKPRWEPMKPRWESVIRRRIAVLFWSLKWARNNYDWYVIGKQQSAVDAVVELASDLGVITRDQYRILQDAIFYE